MNLEYFLDHELEKDTSDVVFIDQEGNDITSSLKGKYYSNTVFQSVEYVKIARITVHAK